MESSATTRFQLKSLFVSLACIAGALAGGVLLYRDFTAGSSSARGAPIATLEKREAKVRRKPASSYIWEHIEDTAPLYLKESLQTGPESAAVVRLQDGSTLELGENSLVVIDRTAELSLNYLKGSLILRQNDGQDKQIIADASGKTQVRTLDLRLLRPESLARFYVDESNPLEISFAWESKSATNAVVEISPDRTFRPGKIIRIKPESPTSARARGLSPGQHFWRVVSDSGEASQTRTFRIGTAVALSPVAPIASERIHGFGDKSSVQFRWKPLRLSYADDVRHEIEVSRDARFQEILFRQTITSETGIAAISGIASGSYHWRVKSRFGGIEKLSSPQTFLIERTEKVAIELLGPMPESILPMQRDLRFVWRGADHPELEYALELLDQNGESVSASKGNATAFTWKSMRSGTFRWRVSALWDGRSVGSSSWSNFTVSEGDPLTLVSPENAKDLLYWEKPLPFSFEWNADPLVTQGYAYQLQVATDREFKNLVLSKQTNTTSMHSSAMPNANGTLYWRVRIVGSSGEASGRAVKTSDVRTFRAGQHPILAAPSTIPSRKIFNVRDDESPPVLQWSEVASARSYEITFTPESSANGGRSPTAAGSPLVRAVQGTSFTVPELPEGTYTWKVQAIDVVNRRGSASVSGSLEVTYGAPLPAPKILSSEVQ